MIDRSRINARIVYRFSSAFISRDKPYENIRFIYYHEVLIATRRNIELKYLTDRLTHFFYRLNLDCSTQKKSRGERGCQRFKFKPFDYSCQSIS